MVTQINVGCKFMKEHFWAVEAEKSERWQGHFSDSIYFEKFLPIDTLIVFWGHAVKFGKGRREVIQAVETTLETHIGNWHVGGADQDLGMFKSHLM